MAILPTCLGTSSLSTHPDLYLGLPALPFPLEMVALCMLRTLQRKKHEGGLDACTWWCVSKEGGRERMVYRCHCSSGTVIGEWTSIVTAAHAAASLLRIEPFSVPVLFTYVAHVALRHTRWEQDGSSEYCVGFFQQR